MLPWVICAGLIVMIIVLILKIAVMRRSMDEICECLSEHLSSDTNQLITVSSNDRYVQRLALRINEQLRTLRKEHQRFQKGDRELKEAVTNISHDLRTPLTAIGSYLDLLDREEKSETVCRYLAVIKNRAEAMKRLTGELFQYSIVISAQYDLDVEPVSVNHVLEESILDFYGILQQKNITPNIHMTEHKIIRNVNRMALSRIFSNLMSNAMKYSDGDLEISLTDTGEITFSNAASGLSTVEVERLFDRFYTVESARKSTGLGLSISRILIEKMKGEISAQYKNGRLSIYIQLPEN